MLALAVAAPGGPAQAGRPDTRAMTCADAQLLVRRAGAVVMTTGRYTYDRIVAGVGWCDFDEETRLVTAPTIDNPRCRIGYVCRPATLFEDFFRFPR
ncbi:MAG: hypothetical protein BroJett030_21980 [Alphaproteobacteria bacterium]|nr:MAG: hypothetical protein BroJett030_21980 [Alphaproteobacteria bacterium]